MKILFSYTRLPKPRGRALYRLQFSLSMEGAELEMPMSLGNVQVPLNPLDADGWGTWFRSRPYPLTLYVESGCLTIGIPFPALRAVRFHAETAAERERFVAALHALVAEIRARWVEYWRTHPPLRGDCAAHVFTVRLPSPADIYWSAEGERLAASNPSRRYALDEPSPGCPEAV